MSTIAQRLLEVRGKEKQGDFAKKLGVNANTLRSYENGRSHPNQEFLALICRQFSVSATWLLLGVGSMYTENCTHIASSQQNIKQKSNIRVHAKQDADIHIQTNQETPMRPACTRCIHLEHRLEKAEDERWHLSEENRTLLKEIAELRLKNMQLQYVLEQKNIG